MTKKIPILLDTDIGSDIDDAVCLSYLLKEPRCELVGITTVSGQPKNRAALADAVCRGAGFNDVPVYSGIDKTLLGGIVQEDCWQALALPKLSHRSPDTFDSYGAVPAMQRIIRARPGEITLLGIGPMMNVATLFAMDPEIPKLLKSIVLMCGCFFEPRAYSIEWNARLDPTATAIVYNAPVPEHVSVGLDVTMQVKLQTSDAAERFRQLGGPLGVVAEMIAAQPKKPPDMTFHDPLAGVMIFEPSLCTWEDGDTDVELLSRTVGGMTHFRAPAAGTKGRHRAAKTVQVKPFFDQFFSVFS